jgi:hypothetical protein
MEFRKGSNNPYQQRGDEQQDDANFSIRVVRWGWFGGLCVMYTVASLIYFLVTGFNAVEAERFAAKQWVDAAVVAPAKQNGWVAVSNVAEWANGFIYNGDNAKKETQNEQVTIINSN